jgi:hypothetical protein
MRAGRAPWSPNSRRAERRYLGSPQEGQNRSPEGCSDESSSQYDAELHASQHPAACALCR